MIREATAMNVRQNLGELLNEIKYHHDQILITKGGKPVAAMVDIELFEKICLMKKRFDALSVELSEAFSDMSEQDVLNVVDEAVHSSRK